MGEICRLDVRIDQRLQPFRSTSLGSELDAAQKVTLAQDAENLSVRSDDRKSADAAIEQERRNLGDRCLRVRRHDLRRHHVSCFHQTRPPDLVRYPPHARDGLSYFAVIEAAASACMMIVSGKPEAADAGVGPIVFVSGLRGGTVLQLHRRHGNLRSVDGDDVADTDHSDQRMVVDDREVPDLMLVEQLHGVSEVIARTA
jgi:hypothetical protein